MTTHTVPTSSPLTASALTTQINAVSLALANMIQGATAPTAASTGYTSIAGLCWHDTANNQIKIRDQADTAWIVVGTLDESAKTFSPAVAVQADMEAATSLALVVPPGRQRFHPGHPKAVVNFSFSGTAITGNIISLASNVITWSTAHGLTTGDFVYSTGGVWPTGFANGAYVRAVSTTTFTCHPTYDDAVANTNIAPLSGGSGTRTASKLIATVNFAFGLAATVPIRPVSGAYAGGPSADSPQVRIYWAGALSSVSAFLGQATGGANSFGGFAGNVAAKATATTYTILDWQSSTQTWAGVATAGTNTGFSFQGDLV